ncbi:MAG: hypothetical protein QOJ81_2340 [Chloroflexota bacterium]|jgi:ABC-2 type transport system ATP-binding protein|nr:hypothetical protein [Chloroflexota bacterium]
MGAVIHSEKLTKFYGKHRGMIDIDLDVNEGEAFGCARGFKRPDLGR